MWQQPCQCRSALLQDLFGDGLLSSYAAPPSIAGMYGQQAGRPGFQYGQTAPYQQQPGVYQQHPQPPRPPGLPHGMSFSGGYGQGPSPGGPPAGPMPSFDGLGRQRSHSDATGTGRPSSAKTGTGLYTHLVRESKVCCVWQASKVHRAICSIAVRVLPCTCTCTHLEAMHIYSLKTRMQVEGIDTDCAGEVGSVDPFSGLAPGLGGALPSMPPSRQTSVSSTHSGQERPGRVGWASNPAMSQSFGGQQAQPFGSQQGGGSTQFNDPFAGSSYAPSAQNHFSEPPAQNQYSAPPTASRPPPKASGNPFA